MIRFLEFVKQYYTFMESAKLSITSIESTDGIQLESETGLTDVLLLDATEYHLIIQEGNGVNITRRFIFVNLKSKLLQVHIRCNIKCSCRK